MLRLFWRRRRRIMDEPTEKEILRDAKGLALGTKYGYVGIENEGDQYIKGKKAFVDNTFPAKQRASMKVMDSNCKQKVVLITDIA